MFRQCLARKPFHMHSYISPVYALRHHCLATSRACMMILFYFVFPARAYGNLVSSQNVIYHMASDIMTRCYLCSQHVQLAVRSVLGRIRNWCVTWTGVNLTTLRYHSSTAWVSIVSTPSFSSFPFLPLPVSGHSQFPFLPLLLQFIALCYMLRKNDQIIFRNVMSCHKYVCVYLHDNTCVHPYVMKQVFGIFIHVYV